MKRYPRLLGTALAMVMLAAGAYAASSNDSLISLSYLRDIFFPKAVQAGEEAANQALRDVYDDALDQLAAARTSPSGSARNGGYSDTLQPRVWSDGQTITLPTGSGFLPLEGSARLSHSGAVVDTTNGTETASGAVLVPGHRYLIGEDTSATITVLSGEASIALQGSYALTAGKSQHTPFYDVSQDDWFYVQVNYAYEQGLFSGMDQNHFAPGGSMNRAMLLSVLHRLAGSPAQNEGPSFADVPDGQWYSQAIRWGAAQGITSGTGGNSFSPFNPVTREQTVTLLYNYASQYLKKDVRTQAGLSGYRDQALVSGWARPALTWAVGEGIISGVDNGGGRILEPQRGATRAEMAAMLKAFSEKIL